MSNVELYVQPSELVNEGDTIIFFCQTNSSEMLSYSWYHNGHLLANKLEHKILNNVQLSNSGSFVCVVHHPILGPKSSHPVVLTINCRFLTVLLF